MSGMRACGAVCYDFGEMFRAQGYFYSKPLPIPEYEEFCKKYENEDIQDIIDELNKC